MLRVALLSFLLVGCLSEEYQDYDCLVTYRAHGTIGARWISTPAISEENAQEIAVGEFLDNPPDGWTFVLPFCKAGG